MRKILAPPLFVRIKIRVLTMIFFVHDEGLHEVNLEGSFTSFLKWTEVDRLKRVPVLKGNGERTMFRRNRANQLSH